MHISEPDFFPQWTHFVWLQLIVNLVDVNDNAPQFPSLQPVDVEESRVAGSILTTFSATDADQGSNAALTYNIVAGDTFGKFGSSGSETT